LVRGGHYELMIVGWVLPGLMGAYLYCTLLTQKFLKGELLDEAQMLAVKENQPLAP